MTESGNMEKRPIISKSHNGSIYFDRAFSIGCLIISLGLIIILVIGIVNNDFRGILFFLAMIIVLLVFFTSGMVNEFGYFNDQGIKPSWRRYEYKKRPEFIEWDKINLFEIFLHPRDNKPHELFLHYNDKIVRIKWALDDKYFNELLKYISSHFNNKIHYIKATDGIKCITYC